MARTPEGTVKAAVKALLDQFVVYYFSPAANGYGRAGIPDIICCVRGKYMDGKFLAIECKAGKGKVTALQDKAMEDIRGAGGITFVINDEDSLDGLKTWLETHSIPEQKPAPAVKKDSRKIVLPDE
jgi:hypothetical protein